MHIIKACVVGGAKSLGARLGSNVWWVGLRALVMCEPRLVSPPQDERKPAKVAVGPQSTVHLSTVSYCQ